MKITRGITASVIAAGVAAGFAGPAWADDVPLIPSEPTFASELSVPSESSVTSEPAARGESSVTSEPAARSQPSVPTETFSFNWVDGKSALWTVRPCGTMCLHVSETGAATEPWESDAYSLNGYWTLFVNRPDMILCDDGRSFPAGAQYNWDADGNGMASLNSLGVCGDQPGPMSGKFTLTKIA